MKILSINYPKTSDEEILIKTLTDGYASHLQADIELENSNLILP